MSDKRNKAPKMYAGNKELFAWAMYDFANSGYTTVVLTTIFNVYFIGVVVGQSSHPDGSATFLWTLATSIANALVLLSAPLLGALADYRAIKKRLLFYTTAGCVLSTACLSLAGPGDIAWAMVLVILSNTLFASGENLIAAFLTEIAPPEKMGRISGFAWGLGYLGGIFSLGICLVAIATGESQGYTAQQIVPFTLLAVAVIFMLAAIPTFLWLRERASPQFTAMDKRLVNTLLLEWRESWRRLGKTLGEARRFRDLWRFFYQDKYQEDYKHKYCNY